MESFEKCVALYVFLAALLIGQVSGLGTNTCTNTTFESAQKVFVERLGLSADDYNWKNASKFANMIFDVYAKRNMVVGSYPEESSFVTVCRAYNSMIQSLNDSNINWNSCLQHVFLLQSDVDPVNGKIFAGVFNLIQKQCGPLFYPIVSNWDSCVSLIYNASNGASCFNWTPDVQSDKAICYSTVQSAACLQKKFFDRCGTAEANFIACETVSSFFSGLYPLCVDQCKVEPYTGVSSNLAKMAFEDSQKDIFGELTAVEKHRRGTLKNLPISPLHAYYSIGDQADSASQITGLF